MGYVDKEIARQQKIIGDAVAGKGLQRAIKALQDKSKIGNSLKALPARGAITAKRKTAKRTGTSSAGIASPLTEIAGSRAYHETEQEILSSDGMFSLKYHALQQLSFLDANGATVTVIYLDPSLE